MFLMMEAHLRYFWEKKSPQHKCCAYAGVGIHRKYSPIASNKCSLRGPGGIQCYLCLLLVWVTYWVLFCCLSSMFHCLCLLLVGLVRRAARVRRALAPVILAPRCTGGEGIEGGSSCNQPHQPPPPVKIIGNGIHPTQRRKHKLNHINNIRNITTTQNT